MDQTHRSEARQSDRETGTGARRFWCEALSLAREGAYAEATSFLAKAIEKGQCSEAEALDLQARILAQQGRFLEAESCWIRARGLDPDTDRYDAALHRLRRGRTPVPGIRTALTVAGAGCILALLVAGISHSEATDRDREALQHSLRSVEISLKETQLAIAREEKTTARLLAENQAKTEAQTGDIALKEKLLSARMDELLKLTEDAREKMIARFDERSDLLLGSVRKEVENLKTEWMSQSEMQFDAVFTRLGEIEDKIEGASQDAAQRTPVAQTQVSADRTEGSPIEFSAKSPAKSREGEALTAPSTTEVKK